MSGFGQAVNDIGGAIGDLFGSKGAAAEANTFQGAATLASQNAQLAAASTRIQEAQTVRSIEQSMGTTQADVAGAGFTESGSALDIMRASAQQGALAKALVNIQGAISENAYAAQSGVYAGEAKAANEQSRAGLVSAIASVGGALINGVGNLASAGKTITAGYDKITGLFTGSSTTQTTADAATAAEAQGFSIPGLTAPAASDTGALGISSDLSLPEMPQFSTLDSSISSGADLGSVLDTSATVDTSLIPLDTSADVASTAISDAISGAFSDVASALPYVGLAASIYEDITHPSVGSFLGTAASVAAIALSVICTAFYQRGMISRDTWLGAQRYGQTIDAKTFAGYQLWATPIANRIKSNERFARWMAPIFMPAINEMAYRMGRSNKYSLYGLISHDIMFGVSWLIGRTFTKQRGRYATI